MDDFPPPPPPLHVIIFVVQFSVPEMIPPGEARLLCKGVASALARSPFWLGMTVNLDGDEGDITTTNGSNDDIAAGRCRRGTISNPSENVVIFGSKGDDTACRSFPSGETAALHANSKPAPSPPRSPPPPRQQLHHQKKRAVGPSSSSNGSSSICSSSISSNSNNSDGNRARSTLECWLGGRKRVDPSATLAALFTAASTAASTTATSTPRGNAIGTRNCTTSSGGGCINPGTMSDSSSGAGGLGKHPRSVMTACCDGDPSDADHGAGRRVVGAAADAVTADAVAEAGKQFLRRYHHHVAFRRLAAPITDTETVEMPVPLFPTCIDTCGCMVALGTREGPVLLFDLSPRDQEQEQERHHQKQQASNGSKVVRVYGSLSAGEGPVASVLLDRAKIVVAGRLSRRREGGHFIRIYAVDSTRLLRTLRCLEETVHMSLTDPVLAVLSMPSGRLSFRDIYAPDRTGVGQGNALATGIAAYAAVESTNSGGSHGDSSDIVFHGARENGCVVEVTMSGMVRNIEVSGGAGGGAGGGGGGDEGRLHTPAAASRRAWHVCADMEAMLMIRTTPWGAITGWRLLPNARRSRGAIFRFDITQYAPTDSSASLLHPGGAAISPPPRPLLSVSLARGGLFLVTAVEGAAPRLWDVRVIYRRHHRRRSQARNTPPVPRAMSNRGRDARAVSAEQGGDRRHAGAPVSISNSGDGAARKGTSEGATRATWGLASLEYRYPDLSLTTRPDERANCGTVAERVGGSSSTENDGQRVERPVDRGLGLAGEAAERRLSRARRPRDASVRPWAAGVWAVGATVNAGSGRMVFACSDGRMRIAKLRPNMEEQRLRAAVLRGRNAAPSS